MLIRSLKQSLVLALAPTAVGMAVLSGPSQAAAHSVAPSQPDVASLAMLDLRDYSSRFAAVGLTCASIPLEGGATVRGQMVVTSDSSRRTATATYYVGVHGPGTLMPLGHGKVTVLRHDKVVYAPPPAAPELSSTTRPGPTAVRPDHCTWSQPGQHGMAQVVHLRAVEQPTVAAVQKWCARQDWFATAPAACPLTLGRS